MAADGGTWLIGRPPDRIEADMAGGLVLTLARVSTGDLDQFVTAVNESLEHLRPWIAWAQEPATAETLGAFIEQADTGWDAGRDFAYVIRWDPSGPVIGGCGLHNRNGPGVLEVGYWVHADHVGQGVATAAAEALTAAAFGLAEVDRVEIRCDAANIASAAVAARLGYRRVEGPAPTPPDDQLLHLIWVRDRRRDRYGDAV